MKKRHDLEEPPFHPLMSQAPRRVSRRAMLAGAAGFISLGTAGPVVALQTPSASPDVQVTGEDEAVAILQRSAQAVAELDTFAFELETVRGSSTIMQGFELKSVTGVVRRPTDLQAEVEVSVPFGDLAIEAISVDGAFYIEDPLSDGAWMEIGQIGEAQSLINPDALILTAVRLVQDARVEGTEDVDGVETTVIEGTVDFSGLLENFEGVEGSEQMSGLLADEPVDVVFWIDEQDYIVEVEMLGPIFTTESEDVVRVVRLFDFNEPVEIIAPDVESTPMS